MRFTWITVGLLAMLGSVGCGVGGVDDVEGQQAAGYTAPAQSDQALLGLDGTPAPGSDGESTGPSGSGPVNPGVSNLPTDPVPWHQPNPGDVVDPIVEGLSGMPPIPTGETPLTR